METPSLFDFESEESQDSAKTNGPSGPFVRVRLTVAYDGTNFRGLAPNPGVRTVVGELARVLTPYLRYEPDIVMSGRTDAGVHSSAQVLSFDAPTAWLDIDRLQKMINARLAPEIVAVDARVVGSNFSARFDAVGRRYRYTVLNRKLPDPMLARSAWHVSEDLDLASMRLACDPILGEHDFSSFCRRPKVKDGDTPVSLARRVDRASWHDLGDGILEFRIEGSAFCHQMVRSLVGFHIAVGKGKRSAGEMRAVLGAKDRQAAAQPAPPHGLNLVEVIYPVDL